MAESLRVEITGTNEDLRRAVRSSIREFGDLKRAVVKNDAEMVAANDRASASMGRMERQQAKTTRAVNGFSLSLRKIAIGAAVANIGILSAGVADLGAAAVATVAALAPLSGALVALPAVFGAAGQAVVAFGLAFHGVGKAMSGNQKAFDNLTPAAQEFVKTIKSDLVPGLKDLQKQTQAKMFPGLTSGLGSAMKNFPVFAKIIENTASAIGTLADHAGKLVGSKAFGKDMATIGAGNVRLFSRLGESAISLGDAFRHVMVSAQPLLDWMGKGTQAWAAHIDKLAGAARANGSLASFFDKTKEAIHRVVDIASHLGTVIKNVLTAAFPLGSVLLANLDKMTGKWATFTGSTQGKNAMADFFQSAKAPLAEFGKLLGALAHSLAGLVQDSQGPLTTALRVLRVDVLPVLAKALEMFATQILPVLLSALPTIFKLVGQVLDGIKSWMPVLKMVVGDITAFFDLLSKILGLLPDVAKLPVALAVGAGVFASWRRLRAYIEGTSIVAGGVGAGAGAAGGKGLKFVGPASAATGAASRGGTAMRVLKGVTAFAVVDGVISGLDEAAKGGSGVGHAAKNFGERFSDFWAGGFNSVIPGHLAKTTNDMARSLASTAGKVFNENLRVSLAAHGRDLFKPKTYGGSSSPGYGQVNTATPVAKLAFMGERSNLKFALDLADSIRALAKDAGVTSREMKAGLGKTIDSLINDPKLGFHGLVDVLTRTGNALSGSLDPKVRGLAAAFLKPAQAMREFASNMERMRNRSVRSISGIHASFDSNLKLLQSTMDVHSKRGSQAVIDNMNAAITGIKHGMKDGVIATDKGTREIRRLMIDSLKSLGLSGEQIRAQVYSRTTGVPYNQTKAGKNATGGRLPGPPQGDHLPLLGKGGAVLGIADGGELVVNRHTEARVNRKLAPYGTSLGREVAGENRPHNFATGGRLSGTAGWFGGPNDSGNIGTALGVSDASPGIAVRDSSTLGGIWDVLAPNKRRHNEKQIDWGPAAGTGRVVDIGTGALGDFGYTEGNFPTGIGNWVMQYLGKNAKTGAHGSAGKRFPSLQVVVNGAGGIGLAVGSALSAAAAATRTKGQAILDKLFPTISAPTGGGGQVTFGKGSLSNYAFPLPDFGSEGRVDRGQDMEAAHDYAATVALGRMKVTRASTGFSMEGLMLDGPAAGEIAFYGHNSRIGAKEGDILPAGHTIGATGGAPFAGGTHTEIGFVHGYRASGHYTGPGTAGGLMMHNLLHTMKPNWIGSAAKHALGGRLGYSASAHTSGILDDLLGSSTGPSADSSKKPPSKTYGRNPYNNKGEYHTAAEWRKINTDYRISHQKGKKKPAPLIHPGALPGRPKGTAPKGHRYVAKLGAKAKHLLGALPFDMGDLNFGPLHSTQDMIVRLGQQLELAKNYDSGSNLYDDKDTIEVPDPRDPTSTIVVRNQSGGIDAGDGKWHPGIDQILHGHGKFPKDIGYLGELGLMDRIIGGYGAEKGQIRELLHGQTEFLPGTLDPLDDKNVPTIGLLAGIRERMKAAAEIADYVRENLKLRQVDAAFLDMQRKPGGDWKSRIASNQSYVSKLRDYIGRNTAKTGRHGSDYKTQIEKARTRIRHLGEQDTWLRKYKPTAYHDPAMARTLQEHIADIDREDMALSGSTSKLGSTGRLGQVNASRVKMSQAASSLNDTFKGVFDPSGLLDSQVLERRQLAKTISDLGFVPPTVATPDTPASDNGLADLLKQLNDQLRESLAVSNAQFSVFTGFAPLLGQRLVGTFEHGTVRVPETGLAMVHRDEQIIPDPNGPYGRAMGVAPAAQQVNVYIEGDMAPFLGKVRAEIDGRAATVTSQQLGRKTRLIASAPGGRR